MDESSERLLRQRGDQLDDGLEIGLVDAGRVVLERVAAVGDAIEHRLGVDGIHQVLRGRGIVEVDRGDLLIADIREPPAFLLTHAGIHIGPRRQDHLEQVRSDETGGARHQDGATQGTDVGLDIGHGRLRGAQVFTTESMLATSRPACLRRYPWEP